MIFAQTFEPADLGTIGLLVLLEGALSVDNALVLGVLAAQVPPQKAQKALTFGLVGAFALRLIAALMASYLIRWQPLKLIGAGYLVYLSVRHFFFTTKSGRPLLNQSPRGFWRSVLGIELTDLVFAIDNILAAVALVGPPPKGWPESWPHPKLWVIMTGGMLGVILMRFAAGACVKLLRRFPRMNAAAYLIVLLVAGKLALEWAGVDFQGARHIAFWAFWAILMACLGVGLLPAPRRSSGDMNRAV
jgi:YkoY family integral membrane protein